MAGGPSISLSTQNSCRGGGGGGCRLETINIGVSKSNTKPVCCGRAQLWSAGCFECTWRWCLHGCLHDPEPRWRARYRPSVCPSVTSRAAPRSFKGSGQPEQNHIFNAHCFTSEGVGFTSLRCLLCLNMVDLNPASSFKITEKIQIKPIKAK